MNRRNNKKSNLLQLTFKFDENNYLMSAEIEQVFHPELGTEISFEGAP
jgi:hypothetical protein